MGLRGQEVHLVSSERTDHRHYDITRVDEQLGCGQHLMELNDEEAVFFFNSPCMAARWSRFGVKKRAKGCYCFSVII